MVELFENHCHGLQNDNEEGAKLGVYCCDLKEG
jgi:hypothetical protein